MINVLNENKESDFLIICDHASNKIPTKFKKLGLSKEILDSHIAFDIGAKEVAVYLSNILECPLVMTDFSRLLIDPNRGIDDPTLIMKISDNKIVKGNRNIYNFKKSKEKDERVKKYYDVYHNKISEFINLREKDKNYPSIISIHSFTPVWRNKKRDIDIGILWDRDDRLSKIFLNSLKNIKLGNNKPYSGRLKNDTLYKHATSNGIPNVLIEFRQDLLKKKHDRLRWAKKIYNILKENEKSINSFSIKNYGSYTL